jgi:hypothetical protein
LQTLTASQISAQLVAAKKGGEENMSEFTGNIGREEEDGLGWGSLVPTSEEKEEEKIAAQEKAREISCCDTKSCPAWDCGICNPSNCHERTDALKAATNNSLKSDPPSLRDEIPSCGSGEHGPIGTVTHL